MINTKNGRLNWTHLDLSSAASITLSFLMGLSFLALVILLWTCCPPLFFFLQSVFHVRNRFLKSWQQRIQIRKTTGPRSTLRTEQYIKPAHVDDPILPSPSPQRRPPSGEVWLLSWRIISTDRQTLAPLQRHHSSPEQRAQVLQLQPSIHHTAGLFIAKRPTSREKPINHFVTIHDQMSVVTLPPHANIIAVQMHEPYWSLSKKTLFTFIVGTDNICITKSISSPSHAHLSYSPDLLSGGIQTPNRPTNKKRQQSIAPVGEVTLSP